MSNRDETTNDSDEDEEDEDVELEGQTIESGPEILPSVSEDGDE